MILSLLMLPVVASALTFEVVGPCDAKPAYTGSMELGAQKDLGRASVAYFERDKIPYIGSELGFNSIMGTPTNRDTIEFPAPDEIRAYGWCFEVDGNMPEVMPHEVPLVGTEHIRWFYGFGLSKKNEWISYCTPAHTVKPAKMCP